MKIEQTICNWCGKTLSNETEGEWIDSHLTHFCCEEHRTKFVEQKDGE